MALVCAREGGNFNSKALAMIQRKISQNNKERKKTKTKLKIVHD